LVPLHNEQVSRATKEKENIVWETRNSTTSEQK
jgi:hypothetical protein